VCSVSNGRVSTSHFCVSTNVTREEEHTLRMKLDAASMEIELLNKELKQEREKYQEQIEKTKEFTGQVAGLLISLSSANTALQLGLKSILVEMYEKELVPSLN
jgi:hypothetical protein